MNILLIIIFFILVFFYVLRKCMTRHYNQKLKDINEGNIKLKNEM